MPAAATLTSMHACPMVTAMVPHVGGPIIGPGAANVLIGQIPAAVLGDALVCVGPPDTAITGSATVRIGGRPAVRVGDMTAHGGRVTAGNSTVIIGG